MEERNSVTKFKGNPVTLLGPALKAGDKAPEFLVVDTSLAPTRLSDFKGKIKIISSVPSLDTPVVVYCRTGHQASQTFFVLKHLLGYRNVYWYDAGWTEWAARPELSIVSETRDLKGQK